MAKGIKEIKDQINFLLNRISYDSKVIQNNLSELFILERQAAETNPSAHNLVVVKVKERKFDKDKNFIEIPGLFRELDHQNKVIYQNTKIRLRRERYYLASMVNHGYEIRSGNTIAIVHQAFLELKNEEEND